MVINKFGDRLYKGLVDTITRHLRVSLSIMAWPCPMRTTTLLLTGGWGLLDSCQSYHRAFCPNWLQDIAALVEDAQGDKFLRELKLRWDNHNKSMHMIRDILMVTSTPAILPKICHIVGVICTGDGHPAGKMPLADTDMFQSCSTWTAYMSGTSTRCRCTSWG
jgi:hypothetical protein